MIKNDNAATVHTVIKKAEKPAKRSAMSRDRRIEANARERKRVHTITAAYDKLQAILPLSNVETNDAKLSKLSVIKIATAYILALSRMACHEDYTEDKRLSSVEDAMDNYHKIVMEEIKTRPRTIF